MSSQLPASQAVTSESFEPSNLTNLTSRSGASFAVCIERPVTRVLPIEGVTIKPDGWLFFPSKFKYFVGFPSIALATPSDPGLFADEAITGSPGCTTLWDNAAEAKVRSAKAEYMVFFMLKKRTKRKNSNLTRKAII